MSLLSCGEFDQSWLQQLLRKSRASWVSWLLSKRYRGTLMPHVTVTWCWCWFKSSNQHALLLVSRLSVCMALHESNTPIVSLSLKMVNMWPKRLTCSFSVNCLHCFHLACDLGFLRVCGLFQVFYCFGNFFGSRTSVGLFWSCGESPAVLQ